MARFGSKTFRKYLRRLRSRSRANRATKRSRRLSARRLTKKKSFFGGGNTLNRNIPEDAVIVNPISDDSYRGNDAV